MVSKERSQKYIGLVMRARQLTALIRRRGASGGRTGRRCPLLVMVQPGDVIVTPRMDQCSARRRYARHPRRVEETAGGAAHMIDLGGDVLGNGIGKLVFTILAAVADNERERIAERIREVKRDMSQRGLHSGGERPFGYDIVREGKLRRLVPNDAEQRIIAEMRAARARGDSYRAIGSVHRKQPMTVRRILMREDEASAATAAR
jgi:DNA invertase Pin-like site-specific DNA recombinase